MNRFAPPAVEVADIATSAGPPRLFKTSGVALAALLGGALAAGYLTYRNLMSQGRPQSAKRAAIVFGLLAIAFLVAAWYTPPDLISQLLSVGIPQLVLVLFAKRWLQGPSIGSPPVLFRSNWLAVGVGVLGNVATKVLFFVLGLATAGALA
jgi:hypothetical protein